MTQTNTLPNLGKGKTLIYGCIVGSQAYGTNVEGSDVDKKWVYVQSADDFFINGYKPQVEISKDEVAYELSRFLELAEKANPTILELLFSPKECVLYCHPVFEPVLRTRKSFLTKACKYSFAGYAISQIEKAKGLDKKMNWEKEQTTRKTVLDFCYFLDIMGDKDDEAKYVARPMKEMFTLTKMRNMGLASIPHARDVYNIFHDAKYHFKGVVQDPETSNDISLSSIPNDAFCVGMMVFNKDGYTQHCKAYREYEEWLAKRNTQRYVDIESHGQKIDGKNLLHCVRLIETAQDIAEFGELIVRRDNAEYLKEIRHGKHNLDQLLGIARVKIEQLDALYKNSNLPDKVIEKEYIKDLNATIRRLLHITRSSEVTETI
jgi:uncharacterized protein